MYVCSECGYPALHAIDHCDNPACFANPTVPEKQKEAWRVAAAKRAADEAERARIRAIHRRMAGV